MILTGPLPSLAVVAAIPAQGAAWPFVVDFFNDHALEIIVALIIFAGMLRIYAWTQLEEFNTFDMVMRGTPYEDLSSRGQAALVGAWIFGVAACALVVIHYVAPNWPL